MVISGSFVFGEEASPKNTNKNYAGHPHCGLYCLYSILKLEGQSVDFRDLVKPEYLGSRKGSSFEELKQASQDFGLSAVSLSRLMPVDLKDISVPAILHVKSGPDKKDYDHFVLYLGEKNGKAMILNPPVEMSLVEFSSLTPKWDGNALVISSEPVVLSSINASSKKRMLFYACMAGLVVAAVYSLKRFLPVVKSLHLRFGLSIGQAVGFAIFAVFAGLLFHFFNGGGFFANAAAVEGIQKAYAGSFIPKITSDKMQTLVGHSNTVIIDARLEQDYKSGHIENAISLPINCSDEVYSKIVSGLTKDKRIILYCQSAGCQFAEKIALRLKADGFENLAVFKGGWVEWQKAAESQSVKKEDHEDEKSA
jgi:rhodanese-related sulfurtransferase